MDNSPLINLMTWISSNLLLSLTFRVVEVPIKMAVMLVANVIPVQENIKLQSNMGLFLENSPLINSMTWISTNLLKFSAAVV